MDETDEHYNAEIETANEEFVAMLGIWRDRSADPLVVCTVMLAHIIALAGHTFASDEDYDRFLMEVIKKGKARYEWARNTSPYVN